MCNVQFLCNCVCLAAALRGGSSAFRGATLVDWQWLEQSAQAPPLSFSPAAFCFWELKQSDAPVDVQPAQRKGNPMSAFSVTIVVLLACSLVCRLLGIYFSIVEIARRRHDYCESSDSPKTVALFQQKGE